MDRHERTLYRDVDLPHCRDVELLGVAVRFESNDPALTEAAREAFGGERSLPEEPRLSARIRLILQPGDEGPAVPTPVRYRCPDPNRLLVATPGSFAVAEIDRREAVAYVTRQLVEDAPFFQHAVLKAITLVLATWGSGRQPVHATTLAVDGVGLLLAGPSGTGKSSVAYAAARAGIPVVGEDAAYLQREPEFCLRTIPGPFHLMPDAAKFFPELARRAPQPLANGKRKIVVGHPRRQQIEPPRFERMAVCLLARHDGPPRIEPINPATIHQALMDQLEPGFDLFPESVSDAYDQLASRAMRAWRLYLSHDPRESVPLIRSIVGQLRAAAGTRTSRHTPQKPVASKTSRRVA